MARSALLCGFSLLAAAAAEDNALRQHFRGFVASHGRDYAGDSEEYERRFALFQQHVAAVEAQNAQAGRRWTAGVNGLADRTAQELAALRGYRHGARSSAAAAAAVGGLGLATVSARDVDIAELPRDFSWKPHLQAMLDVVDQGRCGSCWAVSSATVLRAHSELYQADRKFSVQQIVDCTPNPKSCGGQGGCKGATAELAMEYAAKRGLVLAEERAYTATDNDCPSSMQVDGGSASSFLALRGKGGATVHSSGDGSFTVEGGDGAKFGLIGWRKLPENKAEPLMEALYTSGPVTVSVAASSEWSLYSSGVMDACERDAVINHAVVLTGFGKEKADGYWQIQNSWGPSWGESGFIRILRRDTKEENDFCGWDNKPEEGTACAGGPSRVRVCGSCGVLYDSVVPIFRSSPHGWWHQHGNRSLAAAAA